MVDDTFFDNTAEFGGAVFDEFGAATVAGSTFLNDTSTAGDGEPAGFDLFDGGTLTLSTSILDNAGCFDESEGFVDLTDGGGNVESDNSCGFGSSSLVNNGSIDLAAAPAANGSSGPETLAIDPESSALEEVPAAECASLAAANSAAATDERGDPRPGFPGQNCDAGAFEFQGMSAPQNLTAQAGDGSVELNWSAPATFGSDVPLDSFGEPEFGYHVLFATSPGAENPASLFGCINAAEFYTGCTPSGFTNGTKYYFVVVARIGDGNAKSAFSNEVSATPFFVAPSVSLMGSPNPVTVGGSVTYTATVSGTSDGPTPTGSVDFNDGTSSICANVMLSDTGVATCPVTSIAGSGPHNLTATYSGDTYYSSGSPGTLTETVDGLATSTKLTVPSSLTYGNEGASALKVSVSSTASSQVPAGTVAITSGTTTICTVTLSRGAGACTLGVAQLPVGTATLKATYAPSDGVFATSTSANATLKIAKGTTKLVAAPAKKSAPFAYVLSATLTYGGSGAPVSGASVVFSLGSNKYVVCTATTNASGVATCTDSRQIVIGIGIMYLASYSGTTNATGSSNTAKM